MTLLPVWRKGNALRLKRLADLPHQDFKLANPLLGSGERFLESDDFLVRGEIERPKVHRNFLLVRMFVVNRA